ncbi:MAG: hypothetical protein JRE70_11970, partial [Deltaproteobacteria bacterium]|nr:hypothetical protein [Deltaproteobacteria bacterium]
MPSLRSLFIIAALSAASFGLGYWIGGREDREVAFDLDHAAEVLLSASRASTRRGQAETLVPVLMRMQPADFEALAPVVESTFGVGGGGRAMQLFVERWASLDAPGADVRVKAWPPDRRREVLPGLLRSWVRVDPVAALAALDAVEDANHRVLAFEGLVEGWADSGDPAVWDYLAGLEEGKRRRKALIVVMHQIAAKEGLDALRERVEALPGEPPQDRFKNEALNWAADIMVRIDLQQAVAFATAC